MSRAGRRRRLLRAGSVRAAGGDCTMAPDPWFSTYDSTCQIAQEIAEKIQQRNQYERKGEKTSKLTVTIRALLQNLKEKIALLKDLLLRAVSTHQITQLEGDRRQNLLDDLVTRERLLLASFKNEGAEPDIIRSSLMSEEAKRGAPNPWLFEEPEETRGLGFDEIRQQQQQIIQEAIWSSRHSVPGHRSCCPQCRARLRSPATGTRGPATAVYAGEGAVVTPAPGAAGTVSRRETEQAVARTGARSTRGG
ncbi:PREDICTED: syntaxin-8 [Galeopterus variegatus]|uniref:Syntaxin-8 n=1 Tax=Galeopterus variegatus TaxID=482537 RepID=A0ABM0SEZ9_GALVR|nr:PREDICTED: syntaxin-8 [Galeopterus variegatus]